MMSRGSGGDSAREFKTWKMAKEDFCFTYYDGDAARDKAHMDRLERGAYDDLISAQRKRGHLSLDDIKKVLSKDFETCWPALEWILKTDPAGKYFIEWLEKSILKSKAHSNKQSQNSNRRIQKNSLDDPKTNLDDPLEDGDGNEKGNDNENKADNGNSSFDNFSSSETSLPLEMLKIWELEKPNYAVDRIKDLPALWGIHLFIIEQVKKARGDPHFETVVDSEILDLWQQLIHEMLKDKFWCNKSLTTLGNSIQEFWNKANKNGNKADSQKRNIRKLEDLLGYGQQTRPHAN